MLKQEYSMKGRINTSNPTQTTSHALIKTKKGVVIYLNLKFHNGIKGYVINNGGSEKEGEEVFQEGLLQLMEMIKGMKSLNIPHVEKQLIAICKGLWFKEKRKNQLMKTIDPELESEYSKKEEELLKRERFRTLKCNLVMEHLKKLRAKCRKILKYYYYEHKSHKKIAELLNPKSTERSVITTKKNCLNDLENSLLIPYKNLLEYEN